MVVAKTRKGKAHENRTKEGPRTGVRTSGKTNSTPACPVYIGQALAEEKKTYRERSQRARGLSLFFMSFGSACPHTLGCIFLCFLNKIEL